jgi:hypothetical protein
MVDWWSETEQAIVKCLRSAGPMSPEDLVRRVDISEGETTAFLCMLAREKKIVIHLVGAADAPESRSPRDVARLSDTAPAHRSGR